MRPDIARERVLVVGEALIDALPNQESVGGSSANVALGLGRLGAVVRLHTAIGPDRRGRRIADHLLESGVELTSASWSLPRTSTAHVEVDSEGVPSYRFEFDSSLSPWDYRGEALVHVGSFSAFLEPGASMVEKFVSDLPVGVIVTFDPNIRATLIGARGDALGRFERLCKRANIVKLSDEDASWLFPGHRPMGVIDAIIGLGANAVVLTQGANGVLLSAGEDALHVAADIVPVIDTVGAGDTFMAALIAGLVNVASPSHAHLARLVAFGTRAAGITVQRHGADLPWAWELAEELESLRDTAT